MTPVAYARPNAPAARPPQADPSRTLLGPDGEPIDLGQEGWVAPHAFNFAAVVNTVSEAYSYRWDEALKDSQANALAMKRDSFYLALHQERTAPTGNQNWEIKVPKEAGQRGQWVKERLTTAVEAIPDLTGMLMNLLEAVWYGRYGSQILPGRAAGGVWTVRKHKPVNGDKIQYGWDDTPIVMISTRTASQYADGRATVVPLDRGGWGLRLHSPEWRQRFVIHKHLADDADYFQGEMAGGVHGVGLRSRVYWSGWMRTEILSWMVGFMQNIGMSDLVVFNYPTGNPAAKTQAEDNARKITNGLALLVARGADERGWPAVEQVQMNANGVKVLTDLVDSYYDRHIERLYVGQSMSSGADTDGSLGGSGKAKFAADTKFQLLKMDAKRLGETLTRDLLPWLQRANCPGTEGVAARFEFSVPDPASAEKLDTALKILPFVRLKEEEVLEVAGFTAPGPHDAAIGGPQPAAGGVGMPGQPPEPGGRAATPQQPEAEPDDDLPEELLALDGEPELYRSADQWVSHTIQAGPRKGQTAYLNPRTGELRDQPPGRAATPQPANPNALQRVAAGAHQLKAKVGAAVSEGVDMVPGGRVLKAMGKGAVKLFHLVEKPLMAAMAATQTLARQAAYERGLSDAHVDVLGRVLAVADFAGGYGGAALGYMAAGAVGGKVGSFMPTASVVYLAYSTARDPLATLRAAKRLVRAQLAQAGQAAGKAAEMGGRAAGAIGTAAGKVAEGARGLGATAMRGLSSLEAEGGPEVYAAAGFDLSHLGGVLADSLKASTDADWWQACVLAALGDTSDPHRSAEVAADLADQKPMHEAGEIGAAMIHLAAMGNWAGVDDLGAMADDPHAHEEGPQGDDPADGGQTATGGQIERYAKPGATWQPYTHPKTGRAGWKSAGGLVRYTRPGGLDAPHGPAVPHRVLHQRTNADAQVQAVGITNRLAQGHPPTADELVALPGLLRSLTSAQILALNKTAGAHGGRLKADRIAHYVAKVNEALAARPASPSPTSPPPAPPPPPPASPQAPTSPAARPPDQSPAPAAGPPAAPPKAPAKPPGTLPAVKPGAAQKPDAPEYVAAGKAMLSDDGFRKDVADVYNQLVKFPEFRDGMVDLPTLYAELKDKRPALTKDQFHAAVDQLGRERQGQLHPLNEERTAPTADANGSIRRNDRLYHYLKFTGAKADPDGMRPAGTAPEPLASDEVIELVPAPAHEQYQAAHAPKGGVSVGGTRYDGGQFIPAGVVARASPAEREAIKSGGRAATPRQGKAASASARSSAVAAARSIFAPDADTARQLDAAGRDDADARRETRKLANQAHHKWERVLAGATGWRHEGGQAVADVRGEVTHQGGKTLGVLMDGKVVTSATGGYTLHESSARRKWAEADPKDTLVAQVALNLGSDHAARGVYLTMGATSFSAKPGAKGVLRLMDADEMATLTDAKGLRLLRKRLVSALASADLTEYRAMAKEKSSQVVLKQATNLGEAFEGAVLQGNKAEEVAATVVGELSDDVAEAMLAALKKRVGERKSGKKG